MNLSFKAIIVIFLAFWLAIQAEAGFAMALTSTHEAAAMTIAAGNSRDRAMPDDCPMHHHAGGRVVEGTKLGAACNHCGACQLAASGFLLSSEPAMPLIVSAQSLFLPYKAMFLSHIPDPPQQPPKHFA